MLIAGILNSLIFSASVSYLHLVFMLALSLQAVFVWFFSMHFGFVFGFFGLFVCFLSKARHNVSVSRN